MSRSVPASGDEITPAWLGEALGRSLPGIAGIARIGAQYGFSSELFRVAMGDGGDPSTFVVKLWSTDGPAGVREVPFYAELGDEVGIRVPRCFHGSIDDRARRGVLILEDVRHAVQGDCLDNLPPEDAGRLAREIARLHARWWLSEGLRREWLPSLATLAREEDWLRTRGPEFLERFGDRLAPECRPFFDAARAVHAHANAVLSGLPETLIHSDLHLDNLMFEGDGKPVFLDWARVARGPAVLDVLDVMLATHAASGPAVVEEYLDAVRSLGVKVDGRGFRRGISGAMLRRFLAWTLGVVRWKTASAREERIRDEYLARGQAALIAWREHDPEGFAVEGVGGSPRPRTS